MNEFKTSVITYKNIHIHKYESIVRESEYAQKNFIKH
jgi:hypothetical protein